MDKTFTDKNLTGKTFTSKRGKVLGAVHLYVKSTLISVLIGELITIAALLLFSVVMLKMTIPTMAVDIFVLFSVSLGSLVAGYLNGKMRKEKGMLLGALCGAILILLLLLFNVAFSDFTSTGMTLLKLALMLVLSGMGGILGVNKKAKRIKY